MAQACHERTASRRCVSSGSRSIAECPHPKLPGFTVDTLRTRRNVTARVPKGRGSCRRRDPRGSRRHRQGRRVRHARRRRRLLRGAAVVVRRSGTARNRARGLYGLRSMLHGCVSREFANWATSTTSPITVWLRALARAEHERCGGPGVGAVGMCFTGGFALAMMVDDELIAPVLSQPSLPFPIGKKRKRDLGDLRRRPRSGEGARRRRVSACSDSGSPATASCPRSASSACATSSATASLRSRSTRRPATRTGSARPRTRCSPKISSTSPVTQRATRSIGAGVLRGTFGSRGASVEQGRAGGNSGVVSEATMDASCGVPCSARETGIR